jgi:serine O-acetyltransferase
MTLQFDPSREEFEAFLNLQLGLVGLTLVELSSEMPPIYQRLAEQFSRVKNKYYHRGDVPVLRLGHNAQYTVLLYHMARSAFADGRRGVADRIYSLLRMVSGADLYYEVALPKFWGCDHPLGSVIGRGHFDDGSSLFFSQNCNIGNNGGIFPRISGSLYMLSNSSVLGKTHVTGNVLLANGACAIDAGDLADCIVFGRSPNLSIKPITSERYREMTPFWKNSG